MNDSYSGLKKRARKNKLRRTRADMIGTDDQDHYFDCHEAASNIDELIDALDELQKRLTSSQAQANDALATAERNSELVNRLQERVRGLESDALRYRWLRDVGDDTWTALVKRNPKADADEEQIIDAAIDAARESGDAAREDAT